MRANSLSPNKEADFAKALSYLNGLTD